MPSADRIAITLAAFLFVNLWPVSKITIYCNDPVISVVSAGLCWLVA